MLERCGTRRLRRIVAFAVGEHRHTALRVPQWRLVAVSVSRRPGANRVLPFDADLDQLLASTRELQVLRALVTRGRALDAEGRVRAFDAVVVLVARVIAYVVPARVRGGQVRVRHVVRVGSMRYDWDHRFALASRLDLRVFARDQLHRELVFELDRVLQLRQKGIVLAAQAFALVT